MSITAIPTYVTNQLITASHANTYWRDNINGLFPHTAVGDLAYASAVDALSALAIGQIGRVLRVNSAGALPEWGSPFILQDSFNLVEQKIVTATSWTDVADITKDVTVPVDCTLLVFSTFRCASYGSDERSYWRLMIDGVGQKPTAMSALSSLRYVPITLIGFQAVSAGIITVKLQAYNSTTIPDAYSHDHYMLIFGMAMS